ncbi:NAD(P)-dependent alcohol dehydrogenase [Mobilicoccus pelagius]|uniref:alcohol dehydrogenase (NADP(+)) n=1 Tax=Mobilicoccus pelagius NBRC 104925 TaxID=1089455 RepID=H5UT17_9MICO|nr:NAD(P)-dependent alcohol dehydrogenase [Mobilicoccus pelagius]GAB48875.1 putative NADP-dependent alcohol dehydrogenase [Mobilicoccus pelagius NBRC 104925]
MQVKAIAAVGPDGPLEPTTIERRDVGPDEVRIAIKFAGICHSDIHTVRAEWGTVNYPIVVGHEIAGVVEEVGENVTDFKVGDHAGIGCFVDSCRECENCEAGLDNYCLNGNTGTYNSIGRDGLPTAGGYSEQIVADARYVLHIPESLPLDEAAPLLCAGVTTFSPLRHWNAGPGKKVAVIGLGGLGHMAVKLAHAMGAEVTVLSQSLKKKEDGERLGADHYYATSDETTFTDLRGAFDLILNTVSANLDLKAYLSLLRTDGAMVELGLPEHPMEVPAGALVGQRRSLSGSMIGSIAETQEMLDFCGEHGIGAEVEVISADEVNEAYDRVLHSDVRYRFVIDTSTL